MSDNQGPRDSEPRIQLGTQVQVTRNNQTVTGIVAGNRGPAYWVRFADGQGAWYDGAALERENLRSPRE